jgi:hypothetical protein
LQKISALTTIADMPKIKSTFTKLTDIPYANSNATLFAGTYYGGVFRSLDSGITWHILGSGLQRGVRSLIVNGSTVFAGTFGGGIFKANIGSTSLVSVYSSTSQPSIRMFFAPHPVLDRTRLTLDIPKTSMVELRIFDALGRLVRHQVLGELATGTHDVEQDLRTLPNGTYSVVVQAGSERTHKLLQILR